MKEAHALEILKTHDLCKTYGSNDAKVEALKQINLTVQQGEFVAIVGASGSGKSSLLHLLEVWIVQQADKSILTGRIYILWTRRI